MIGEMELAAIWVSQPVWVKDPAHPALSRSSRLRLCEGMKIVVQDENIVDVTDETPPTHKIIGCFGTIDNSILHMTVMDLKTNELLTINMK